MTTSTSRKARRLRPQVVESPRSVAFGSVPEARQAGAEPHSPAATIEPAKANRKTRQSTVTFHCTGKSIGARQRLRAEDRNDASREPAPPPATERTRASVTTWRTTR